MPFVILGFRRLFIIVLFDLYWRRLCSGLLPNIPCSITSPRVHLEEGLHFQNQTLPPQKGRGEVKPSIALGVNHVKNLLFCSIWNGVNRPLGYDRNCHFSCAKNLSLSQTIRTDTAVETLLAADWDANDQTAHKSFWLDFAETGSTHLPFLNQNSNVWR